MFYPRFLARRTLVRLSLVSQGFLLKIRLPGLPHFGITKQKTAEALSKAVLLSFLYVWLRKSRLKTCGFLRLIRFFCFILVSSLSVPSYASRSSAKDFFSKSVCPGFSLIKNSLKLQFQPYFSRFCIDLLEFLMRHPLFVLVELRSLVERGTRAGA